MKQLQSWAIAIIALTFTSTLFAQNDITDAFQDILDGRGNFYMTKILDHSTSTLSVFQVHSRTEKFRARFRADHWLDLTDEVVVSGSGVSFSKIISKGKQQDPRFKKEYTYCEVEFTIASTASLSDRTIRLRRPNLTFGKDETTFTLKVKKSARIYEIGLSNLSPSPARNDNRRYSLQATVQGFDQVTGFSNAASTTVEWLDKPAFFGKGKFQFDFAAGFRRGGNFNTSILASCLSKPTDVTILTKNGTTGIQVANINGNPPPNPPTPNPPTPTPPISGGVVVGGGNNNPPAAPDLSVTFLSTFTSSGNNFNASEMGSYSVCPTSTNPKITTIPALKIRVTNIGTANSNACTLTFNRNTNSNFQGNLTFNVPILAPGATADFTVPRIESRVCGTNNSTGACIRCGNGVQSINHWNDRNASATLSGVTNDSNPSNNTQTIF